MAPAKKPAKGAKASKPKQKTAPKPAAAKAVATAPAVVASAAAKASANSADHDLFVDAQLFDPLTPGEIADALRTLTEDRRLSSMAKVGRYRVICTEPLVVKPPHLMSGHRLARVVAFDYAADRTVEACIDLDAGVVAHLELTQAQPMLSRDEEALAVSIAMVDDRVREQLALGDVAQSTLHYWGRSDKDLAFARRSAAVVFGRGDGGQASVVAVVDLIENIVTQVVPAEQW
jgi:Cu2+-containing amine oxidase